MQDNIDSMQPSAPVLAPILRSDSQGRLLAELYLHPEKERTATELAALSETGLSTVSRELSRLIESNYLHARHSGRNRYVRINTDHPLFQPLSEIVIYAYGPVSVLSSILKAVPEVQKAYIYGSWAARLAGEPGPDPNDIDVLIIGDGIDYALIDELAEQARKILGREVNPRILTNEGWEMKQDVFLKHLSERPLIEVPLDRGVE